MNPECEHDYDFLYSDYEKTDGTYKENYKQIDVFHCRKCLEYQRVVVRNEDERYKPSWYKA